MSRTCTCALNWNVILHARIQTPKEYPICYAQSHAAPVKNFGDLAWHRYGNENLTAKDLQPCRQASLDNILVRWSIELKCLVCCHTRLVVVSLGVASGSCHNIHRSNDVIGCHTTWHWILDYIIELASRWLDNGNACIGCKIYLTPVSIDSSLVKQTIEFFSWCSIDLSLRFEGKSNTPDSGVAIIFWLLSSCLSRFPRCAPSGVKKPSRFLPLDRFGESRLYQPLQVP
jgi:hypothetical protein